MEIDVEDIPVEDFAELQAELEAQEAEAAMQEEAQEDILAEEEAPAELGEVEAQVVEDVVVQEETLVQDEVLDELEEAEVQEVDDEDLTSPEGASEEE